MIEQVEYARAFWFGASDGSKILAKNQNTATWKEWWEIKCGRLESNFGNVYTEAGTLFEHPILKTIDSDMRLDLELRIPSLCLRVHYDGDIAGTINECKTFKATKTFEVSKPYWQQAQIEMYVFQEFYENFKGLNIRAYPMTSEDYKVRFEDEVVIDESKVLTFPVKYDKYFIKAEVIPQLKTLAKRLKKDVGKDCGVWEIAEF